MLKMDVRTTHANITELKEQQLLIFVNDSWLNWLTLENETWIISVLLGKKVKAFRNSMAAIRYKLSIARLQECKH